MSGIYHMACPSWQIILTATTESTAVSIQSSKGMANPYTMSALQVLICMIFLKSIWNKNHHWYYTHFADKEIDAQSAEDLTKVKDTSEL